MVKQQVEIPEEIRKIQAFHQSNNTNGTLGVVLPSRFTKILKLVKGDFLKINLDNRKIVMEKA